jgi:RNA polymerase sigma-70 factor (ECF subfamily)
MDASDAELVRAVRDGRREAYDELVRRHAAKIGAVCRSRLGPRGPVDDLVQETFLRGFRGLATLAEPQKFASWLHGIADRSCLDWLKAKERTQVSFGVLGPDGIGSGEVPEASDRHAKLLEEIGALPELYREVVMLFYYKKQSYQEMSELLSITPAAINARLTKARALLRSRLAGAVGS